jgi:heme-degrading monooxygenase HmoA
VSVVKINAITVPEDRREEFERRFANRAGEVGKSPGFESFELLRPDDGHDVYFVYTRWRSNDDFMAWVNSRAFQHGHAQHEGKGPAGTHSELLSFEVIQQEEAAAVTTSGEN